MYVSMYVSISRTHTHTHQLVWIAVYLLFAYMIIILVYHNISHCVRENFGSECMDFIPFKPQIRYPFKKDAIFVSVASYRDDECHETLRSIFQNASNYQNIYVGVCQQNKDSEETKKEKCEYNLPEKYQDNVRIINMNFSNAKGPTYARYWCATLWRGEEFFLQIDSHTHFQDNWDTSLVQMHRQCELESNRPVLTAYPPTKEQINIDGSPEMCNGKLTNDGIPIFLAGWTSKSDKPKRSPKPFAAAGFMFLQGSFLYDTPYDPNLSHLFQGEETLFSARLFTNGYDFYTPNVKVAWHHYIREGKPKYWDDLKDKVDCRRKAEKRVMFMLGLENEKGVAAEFFRDIHVYGFGKFRTILDYWKTAGIDFTKKTITNNSDTLDPSGSQDPVDTEWNFKISGFNNNIKKWTK